MKIDQLPVEMLKEIFSYLPTHCETSLVNKTFYGVSCKVSDPNICLRIDGKMDFRCVHSIRTSTRQVTKVEIRQVYQENWRKNRELYIFLIGHFSSTIKRLSISDAYLDHVSTFLQVLSSTPNIEHLDLRNLRVSKEDEHLLKRHCNDDLNLKKLKSLSTVRCGGQFIRVFNCLPVGLLPELQMTDFPRHTLTALLDRQLNIKKLKFVRMDYGHDQWNELSADTFEKLKLESLELFGSIADRDTPASILSKQTQLKRLILADRKPYQTPVNDDRIMNAVANLSELQTLETDPRVATDDSFVKIRRLKKLNDLTLRCAPYGDDCRTKLKTLAESYNTSITKLTMMSNFRMSVETIRALAKSLPHLRHLRALPIGYHNEKELKEILARFNFVEVLEIESYRRTSLIDNGQHFNAKLREARFHVDVGYYGKWLAKLTAAYTNLRKLKLYLKLDRLHLIPVTIQPILDGFPMLESLTLYPSDRDEMMVVEDLELLQNRKNNLKFVALKQLQSSTLTDGLIKNLRRTFGVVKVKNSNRLYMAVDRFTMNSESEKRWPYLLSLMTSSTTKFSNVCLGGLKFRFGACVICEWPLTIKLESHFTVCGLRSCACAQNSPKL